MLASWRASLAYMAMRARTLAGAEHTLGTPSRRTLGLADARLRPSVSRGAGAKVSKKGEESRHSRWKLKGSSRLLRTIKNFDLTRATRDAHKKRNKIFNELHPALPASVYAPCLPADRDTWHSHRDSYTIHQHPPSTPPSLRNGAFMVPHSPGGTLCQALCTLPGWGSPHIARFRQRFSLTL